jgi:hypothetical protein
MNFYNTQGDKTTLANYPPGNIPKAVVSTSFLEQLPFTPSNGVMRNRPQGAGSVMSVKNRLWRSQTAVVGNSPEQIAFYGGEGGSPYAIPNKMSYPQIPLNRINNLFTASYAPYYANMRDGEVIVNLLSH